MYLTLSWRNIWRNKKRTIIVAASVFFAVILSAFMRSGQLGSYEFMIHSSTKMYTGYLQIQHQDYWEKRSLDNSFYLKDDHPEEILNIPHVTQLAPRLEAFALMSSDTVTRVSQVIGIHPKYENDMTDVADRLIKGKYLDYESQGVMIGSAMARMLGVDIGDTLALYGVGYHGMTAAALLPVEGIVKLPFKSMDGSVVFMALPRAQDVFMCYDMVTSLPIMIDNIANLDPVLETVKTGLTEKQIVMTWDEMMPDLKQNIEVDNVSGIISLAVLYIVIAFGVFGTVMMMVSERAREFAVLISVGMHKTKLTIVTALESIMVSFLGVIAGIIGSIPLILYFVHNPIYLGEEYAEMYENFGVEPVMKFSAELTVFSEQALVVFIIALVTVIYPILFIRNMEIAKTIRG
jgi:ABC-type lipoprotein release transport system permease subunit